MATKVRLKSGAWVRIGTFESVYSQLGQLAAENFVDFERLHNLVHLYRTNLQYYRFFTLKLRKRGYDFIGVDGSLNDEQAQIIIESVKYERGTAKFIDPRKHQ